jgi:purine-nucleoside phosphorylase
MPLGFDQIRSAAAFVQDRLGGHRPLVGVVLGSGLGAFADALTGPSIPFHEIPHFPVSTVEGHKGRMVAGQSGSVPILCLQGRVHGYEGYSPDEVVFPIRVLMAVGIRTAVITNAAGGINPAFLPGDLMVLSDHINLTGKSALTGPNDTRLGTRFPDMSNVYPLRLRDLARKTAGGLGFQLKEGVYLGVNGPQYETPAEIRAFRVMGADAVGMSTVLESAACSHQNVPVLGISCITNLAAGIGHAALSHEEVKETANAVEKRFSALLGGVCASLG